MSGAVGGRFQSAEALLTFVMFSHVVHAALESMLLRGLIVVLSEVLLVRALSRECAMP